MKSINITTDPAKFSVTLGDTVVVFQTKYNYSANMWVLDILNSDENMIIAGLMLKPNIDILIPYAQKKKTLGSLVLIEKNVGDHQNPDLLGINTVLLWYEPGETVVIP